MPYVFFDESNELVIPLDVALLGAALMPKLPKLPSKLLFNFHDNPRTAFFAPCIKVLFGMLFGQRDPIHLILRDITVELKQASYENKKWFATVMHKGVMQGTSIKTLLSRSN